jgi:hypothetical protein
LRSAGTDVDAASQYRSGQDFFISQSTGTTKEQAVSDTVQKMGLGGGKR